jgi:hypothetical protein
MAGEPGSNESIDAASNPHRMLPGEDPRSRFVEDAQHWISVYTELLAFKEAILQRAGSVIAELNDAAVHDASIDHRLLDAQVVRYRERLAFWSARLTELERASR